MRSAFCAAPVTILVARCRPSWVGSSFCTRSVSALAWLMMGVINKRTGVTSDDMRRNLPLEGLRLDEICLAQCSARMAIAPVMRSISNFCAQRSFRPDTKVLLKSVLLTGTNHDTWNPSGSW